ncbi:MAG: hypothetical protein LBT02_02060, partial [Rickettsiales bacterium]|nr:hypothetical protein [Rickettsiales bacterium]
NVKNEEYNNNKENKPKNILNNTYGYDFNKWFSDRFRKREKLMELKQFINELYRIVKATHPQILNNEVLHWQKKPLLLNVPQLFSQNDLEKMANSYKKLSAWCKKNGIKCYVVYMPIREMIVRDMAGLSNNFVEASDKGEQVNQYLKSKKIDFQVVNLHKRFFELSKKEQPLYWKTDWHQTNTASFLFYQETMKAIKKDFPDIKFTNDDEWMISYDKKIGVEKGLCGNNGILSICPLNTSYKFIKNKNSIKVVLNKGERDLFHSKYENGNDYSILILGASYASRVNKFFSYGFKNYYQSGIFHQGNEIIAKYGSFTEKTIEAIMQKYNFKPQMLVLFDVGFTYSSSF